MKHIKDKCRETRKKMALHKKIYIFFCTVLSVLKNELSVSTLLVKANRTLRNILM